MKTKPNLRLFGPFESSKSVRVPTFSFTVEKKTSGSIPKTLAKKGIAVSNGHFYAKRLIDSMGILDANDGVVRISIAHYNTDEEIEYLIKELDQIF